MTDRPRPSPVDRATEIALVRRVVRGDERAFRSLYREHTPALHRFVLRLTGGQTADAEDVLQEMWTRAVRGLGRFEHRSSLRTWLRAIATRCAQERYRRERRERDVDLEAVSMEGPGERTTSRLDLEAAFAALPFGFRSVLVLHDIEGFRHREIAELLGISPGTSKSQLSRARQRVREALGESYARP